MGSLRNFNDTGEPVMRNADRKFFFGSFSLFIRINRSLFIRINHRFEKGTVTQEMTTVLAINKEMIIMVYITEIRNGVLMRKLELLKYS